MDTRGTKRKLARPLDRTAEPTPTQRIRHTTTQQLLARLVFLSIAADQAEIAAVDPLVPPEERATAKAHARFTRPRWRRTKKALKHSTRRVGKNRRATQ